MKTVMGLLLGLGCAVSPASFAADPTAEQILAKVSQTYRDLRSFRFVEREENQPAASISGILRPADLPAPFGDCPARCTTDLAISAPGRIRLVVSSREAKILLVSDGLKTWVYVPNLNEYLEASAAPLLQVLWTDPIEFIGDDLALYRNLSQEAKRAKLRGEEALSLGGQNVRCYVLDMLANSVWRTLWVDERSFSVLQDKWIFSPGNPPAFASQSNAFCGTAASRTSRVTKADLGPLSSDVFQFAVPNGARRVDSFSAPAAPVQSAEELLGARLTGSKMKDAVDSMVHALQGREAHDFTLGGPGGENVRLHGLHGKIVVLDFCASWCQPCQEELATIQRLHDELASKGVVFLGIDDESPETVKSFATARRYTFPVLLDSETTVHGLYGVRLVPTTVVIDRKGKIAAHYVGAGGEEQLRRALKSAGLNTTP